MSSVTSWLPSPWRGPWVSTPHVCSSAPDSLTQGPAWLPSPQDLSYSSSTVSDIEKTLTFFSAQNHGATWVDTHMGPRPGSGTSLQIVLDEMTNFSKFFHLSNLVAHSPAWAWYLALTIPVSLPSALPTHIPLVPIAQRVNNKVKILD